jgi:CO/xanthine dehydrogenase FAD-binding subunit
VTPVPRYLLPATLAEAATALAESHGAAVLAGGTDLINDIRLGRSTPELVVDIASLPGLGTISITDGIHLGATVTMRAALASPALHGRLGALHDAMRLLGGRQMQAAATLGGNLCHASPAAETATPLLVHDAVAEVQGPAGGRRLPLADLWAGPGKTVLEPGEILTSLVIPVERVDSASAYRRLELRRSVDIAVVSASAALEVAAGSITHAAIAIGAVNPTPRRLPDDVTGALTGVALTLTADGQPIGDLADAITAVAERCGQAARPITDIRASADYRAAMIVVIAERAITAAAQRAAS